MNDFSWDDLRYFLAVAEQGSLSAAAKHLNSNQPTVGRRITALENALGTRLFQRSRAGLALTPEGTNLLEHADRVRSSVSDISRQAGGQQAEPQGSVRIALPEGLCHDVVIPHLGDFYRRCPMIRLILQVSSRRANLTRGEADVALRLFRPEEANLVVRQLGVMEMQLAASAAYLKRNGAPRTEKHLKEHAVITYGDELAGLRENQWLQARASPGRVVLQSDSTMTRLAATEAGLGISIQPRSAIERSTKLRRILDHVMLPAHPIWLVYHRDLKDVHRVRRVIDFLSSLFDDAK